jgi:hypothetical protein
MPAAEGRFHTPHEAVVHDLAWGRPAWVGAISPQRGVGQGQQRVSVETSTPGRSACLVGAHHFGVAHKCPRLRVVEG